MTHIVQVGVVNKTLPTIDEDITDRVIEIAKEKSFSIRLAFNLQGYDLYASSYLFSLLSMENGIELAMTPASVYWSFQQVTTIPKISSGTIDDVQVESGKGMNFLIETKYRMEMYHNNLIKALCEINLAATDKWGTLRTGLAMYRMLELEYEKFVDPSYQHLYNHG